MTKHRLAFLVAALLACATGGSIESPDDAFAQGDPPGGNPGGALLAPGTRVRSFTFRGDDVALRACGGADVAILSSDARPAPGWLQQLAACFARDPAIATATPWSNAGEAASWPRIGEIAGIDEAPSRLARACAQLPAQHPELPAAVGHAVLLRGSARGRAGGLDPSSYGSWYAALIDLSLRLSGLGWRNALCETAFVLRDAEGMPFDGDMDRLSVRWPAWHARLANFLMEDPLHGLRGQLAARLAEVDAGSPQQDLFAGAR